MSQPGFTSDSSNIGLVFIQIKIRILETKFQSILGLEELHGVIEGLDFLQARIQMMLVGKIQGIRLAEDIVECNIYPVFILTGKA